MAMVGPAPSRSGWKQGGGVVSRGFRGQPSAPFLWPGTPGQHQTSHPARLKTNDQQPSLPFKLLSRVSVPIIFPQRTCSRYRGYTSTVLYRDRGVRLVFKMKGSIEETQGPQALQTPSPPSDRRSESCPQTLDSTKSDAIDVIETKPSILVERHESFRSSRLDRVF